ncbi:hypothetical protein [Pseudomonas sp. NPDC087817]|uniref:hypothetical protein n=1 Tax=Pseudomonas sp. NPDC087817 TaxID=3364451 RepID=UPI0037F46461
MMISELFQRFLDEELDWRICELLRTEIFTSQQSDGVVCIREFTFNLFDVVIDFEARTVVVRDVLLPESDAGAVMSLDEFTSVCKL